MDTSPLRRDQHSGPIEVDLPFETALGVARADGILHEQGESARAWDLASVSKPITALAVLIALERGLLELDEPAGPPGATVRHLLAHTAGYPFEGEEPVAEVGARRIYSNTGFEVLAAHLEDATGHSTEDWIEQTIAQPLGLVALEATGSAAAGFRASVQDLLSIGRELLEPTLISRALRDEAFAVQFPGLDGILPGYGRQRPNDWGLGLEIRDGKQPHWTGSGSSPRTAGHFGQSGSFLWVDPDAGLTAAFLGAERFGEQHVRAWPAVTDQILDRFGAGS